MAVARVQVVAGRYHGVGTTFDTNITVSAGSLLIATVCLWDPAVGFPLVSSLVGTGAGSLTFQQDITKPNTNTDGSRIYKFSRANIGAGTYTITPTFSPAATRVVLYLEEVSGAATSSYTDGAGVSAQGNSANPASGGFTASVTDGYWSGGFMNENSSADATVAAGSGWSMDTTNGRTTDGDNANNVSGVENRANPGSAGSFNADFVAASSAWLACVFVYKAASAAGVALYLNDGTMAVQQRMG